MLFVKTKKKCLHLFDFLTFSNMLTSLQYYYSCILQCKMTLWSDRREDPCNDDISKTLSSCSIHAVLCVMYKQMNKKFQCHHIFDLLLLIHITEYRWAKIFPNTLNPSKSIYLCSTNTIDFFRKKNFHLFLSHGPVRIKQEEMGNVLDFLGSLTLVC